MTATQTRAAMLCLLALMFLPEHVPAIDQTARSDPQTSKVADPWGPCRFLLGDWVGVEGSGQPGEAISGSTSFAFDLGDKVLVRRNRADYAPKQGEKTGISHQDLLIIYLPLGETQLKAFYIDNEGHEITYRISFPKDGAAVFESDDSPKAPRYRLDYRLNPDRTLTITFSIAMPGSEFTVYTKGTARRK
ncbi:MAG: hypothetical protein LAP85_13840 [Acidobacteriia bacterium]|nr:hypothetical protein [Terriglobia bacterium]